MPRNVVKLKPEAPAPAPQPAEVAEADPSELNNFFAELKQFAEQSVEPEQIRQLVLAGTPYDLAEAARKPLNRTERLLRSDGFRLLNQPFKATNALFVGRSNCMQAIRLLADPENPHFAAVIAEIAKANGHMADAQFALDPESNKCVEDATLSVAKALKAVCLALEKIDKAIAQ